MSPSQTESADSVLIDKTKEINSYLSNRRLPDGVSSGIKIVENKRRGQEGFVLYVRPYTHLLKISSTTSVAQCLFPGTAYWLAQRNVNSEDPYVALFEYTIESKLFPIALERGLSVAGVRRARYTQDLTRIELDIELNGKE